MCYSKCKVLKNEGVFFVDFIDQIKQFSNRVENLRTSIPTEEATKLQI